MDHSDQESFDAHAPVEHDGAGAADAQTESPQDPRSEDTVDAVSEGAGDSTLSEQEPVTSADDGGSEELEAGETPDEPADSEAPSDAGEALDESAAPELETHDGEHDGESALDDGSPSQRDSEVSTSAPEPERDSVGPVEVEPALAAAVDEALEQVADEADAAFDEFPEWVPGEWYVVHTYAGYENKVKADLETRVASMNMEDKIYEVVIPMEEVVEVKSGKKQKVQRKVFPGYLLVRLELDDESWYVVRNTPGVTGFVGSGSKPTPLSEREVDRILQRGKEPEAERPKPKLAWAENDPVRVTTGPFANFQGVISEVDGEREKVKVLVNIFGRETPVELNFDDIQKV